MAEFWLRKIGTELVLEIKATTECEKADLRGFGKIRDTFTGTLIEDPEDDIPIIQLRNKIL